MLKSKCDVWIFNDAFCEPMRDKNEDLNFTNDKIFAKVSFVCSVAIL